MPREDALRHAVGPLQPPVCDRLGHGASRSDLPEQISQLHVESVDLRHGTIALARADGTYIRLLAKLARLDALVVDDWGLAPVQDPERRDLRGSQSV
jgi:hypothetical protein